MLHERVLKEGVARRLRHHKGRNRKLENNALKCMETVAASTTITFLFDPFISQFHVHQFFPSVTTLPVSPFPFHPSFSLFINSPSISFSYTPSSSFLFPSFVFQSLCYPFTFSHYLSLIHIFSLLFLMLLSRALLNLYFTSLPFPLPPSTISSSL